MRVLVLSHMYPSLANPVHGIFVHEQVRALADAGIEVGVVSPVPWSPFPLNRMSSKWEKYAAVPSMMQQQGIKVWYPRYVVLPRNVDFQASGMRMYLGIRRLVAQIRQEFKFDLIHAHGALPDGWAAWRLAAEHGVPFAVTIHGRDFHEVIRWPVSRRRVQDVLENAARTIVVSEKLRNLGAAVIGDPTKLVVIPNGVDPEKVCRTIPNEPPNDDRSLSVVSVARLIRSKGIDVCLQAVRELRDTFPALRYTVVGSGPDERRLRSMARDLGVSDIVRFVGSQPNETVMRYIATCDVFCLPSWQEAFGIVYLEALAHGKPVVGCLGEGIEDFVENRKTGLLVRPHNVEELVEALKFLFSRPEQAILMGERGRSLILSSYTWQNNALKMIAIFQDIVKRARRCDGQFSNPQ